MDREVKAGLIRGPLGGSKWTMARMDEAIAYAERTGKQKPGALSNNFSLAEMLDPIWPGCVTASTYEWKAWLTACQMPNFAWSSQGRGFFTDRAGRDKRRHPRVATARSRGGADDRCTPHLTRSVGDEGRRTLDRSHDRRRLDGNAAKTLSRARDHDSRMAKKLTD